MQLHNLFPIPIAFFDLDRELTELERKFIDKQKVRPNMGNASSEDNYVLENKNLSNLKSFFEDSIAEYFTATYNPRNDVKLAITQSWINYTKHGEYHHKHAHPNSVVSGVFYIQSDNTSDTIHFYNEKYHQIKFEPKEFNAYNSESWWFESIQGRLLLFPSSLAHMVETRASNEATRISLSFNTFPIGHIGDNIKLTELIIR
jgi:uncharacterized protein (TIGR02466 family)